MNTASIFAESDIKNIEGKILTIIETLGLETRQEEATKSLVRQAIWDEVDKPYRIFLTESQVEKAWQEQEERKKGQGSKSKQSK